MVGEGFEEFVAVVDGGSITNASVALGLPRPTVSKRLARLEERLGVRLLHRTTRRLDLTKEGALFYERARRVVHAATEAEAEIQRLDAVPRGLLRILIPPRVPEHVFAQWLVAFMAKYPEVSLDVVGTDVHVDLVSEGFDVALRYGEIDDTSLIARTLVTNEEIAVASPRYLDRKGVPRTPSDLAAHNCMIGYTGNNVPDLRWPLLDGGWTHVKGDLMANHDGIRLEAAKRDLGIALVIRSEVDGALADSSLVHVLPGVIGRRNHARLVYAERDFVDPKVRAFVDFIVEQVAHRPKND